MSPQSQLPLGAVARVPATVFAPGTYNAMAGLATLPSVLFGVLYESLGPGAAFGFGAMLAVLASLILPSVTSGELFVRINNRH